MELNVKKLLTTKDKLLSNYYLYNLKIVIVVHFIAHIIPAMDTFSKKYYHKIIKLPVA